MEFVIEVTASIERSEGKFATREELFDKLTESIDEPSDIQTDDGATYEVTAWEVNDATPSNGGPRMVSVRLADAKRLLAIAAREDDGLNVVGTKASKEAHARVTEVVTNASDT